MAGAPIYVSQQPAVEPPASGLRPIAIPQLPNELGAHVAALGETITGFAVKLQEAQQTSRLIERHTEFLLGTDKLRQEGESNPDYQNAPAKFQEGIKQLQGDILSRDGLDQHSQDKLRYAMTQETIRAGAHVQRSALSKQVDTGRAALDTQEIANTDAAVKAGSPIERQAIIENNDKSIAEAADAGLISRQDQVQRRARFTQGLESKLKDGQLAGFITDAARLDTEAAQKLAVIDPAEPIAEQIVESNVAKRTALYRQAAESNIISKSGAEKGIIAASNGAWGALVIARAGKLGTPDQVDAFREQFEKDFSAGKYDGKITADGFHDVIGDLAKLKGKLATGIHTAENDLQKRTDDFVKRESSGLAPPAGEWAGLLVASKALPRGDEIIELAQAKRNLAARLNALPIDQGEALVSSLREEFRKSGGVDPRRAAVVEFGNSYVEKMRGALRTDMLGAAQTKGLIPDITPLDFDGFSRSEDLPKAAAALAGQMTARVNQARAVGASLERQPQFLRPEEKARLSDVITQGGDHALGLVTAIVGGAGEHANAVLGEIGDEAPRLAQAGMILNNGGSMQAARDALEFAAVKGKDLPKIGEADQTAVDKATLGQAYLANPSQRVRVQATAEAIARVRVGKEGLDPKLDVDRVKTIYERAVKDASGAIFVDGTQYGGLDSYSTGWFGVKGQVLVPAGVRSDRFRGVIQTIGDDDLKGLAAPPKRADGKSYSAQDLHGAIPIAVPGGYAFATKNYAAGGDMQYLLGKDGKPWVLDWAAVAPELKKRSPGAFLGAL